MDIVSGHGWGGNWKHAAVLVRIRIKWMRFHILWRTRGVGWDKGVRWNVNEACLSSACRLKFSATSNVRIRDLVKHNKSNTKIRNKLISTTKNRFSDFDLILSGVIGIETMGKK